MLLVPLFASAARSTAAERPVSTGDELATAIAASRGGDTILMRDGQWNDVTIDVTSGGENDNPLTIRAQTPGKVILTGSSRLKLSAPHVVIDGLLFKDGSLDKGQVIHFNSDHGRVTNCAVVDYNPEEVGTAYYWVFFEGSHNRLDHCLFKGKNHQQPVIGSAGGGSSPTDSRKPSRHNTVDHCHFVDIPHVPGRNGREIFRIWGYGGNEELGEDGAFFTIERNLFERAHGEGSEIISLKSNRNVVRGNTIRGTRGGITNRSGNFNRIEENIILADGQKGAAGIRLAGQGHVVRGNYIQGCEWGVNVMCGEHFETDLTGKFEPILRASAPLGRVPRYGRVRDVLIESNTLVNNIGPDFILGSNYKSGWPKSQRVLLPENVTIAGNLIIRNDNGAVITRPTQDRTPPLDTFEFKPSGFRDNRHNGGRIDVEAAELGFTTVNTIERPRTEPLTIDDVGPVWAK